MSSNIELTVSDFVTIFNQTLEFSYPSVGIIGELANLRISKNRWVYFDLKDENSTIKFFGVVHQLPGPLEDGLMLKVQGQPRLHNKYGFSVNVQEIKPVGEGSIKKTAELLKAKLQKEGLFDDARKRHLPYPPKIIGLVASEQSAAYVDFIKVLKERWRGIDILFVDVQVQGESSPRQVINAINQLNSLSQLPEAIVITRGGGSAEDLMVFNDERVVRAVSASRAPTLVAIGHEVDLSLSELVADKRASTPSNAAELLVPDVKIVQKDLKDIAFGLKNDVTRWLDLANDSLESLKQDLSKLATTSIESIEAKAIASEQLLQTLNPKAVLNRGYAIVQKDGKVLKNASSLTNGDTVQVSLAKGEFYSTVNNITKESQ